MQDEYLPVPQLADGLAGRTPGGEGPPHPVREGRPGPRHGPRPVKLDPAPQLLR
ncbi:hypothetical protein LV779_08635 [Streptomyces thinghirensis]|nr:hypothetical protein [Streptomyces thinghirensis]